MKKSTLFCCLLAFSLCQGKAQTININGPAGSGGFGNTVRVPTNGNYVITDPLYDEGGLTDIGAVYLYDGNTHALISTLKGSQANDQVGSNGITALNNGNFVVRSSNWHNGANANAGAITWCNGTTGLTGVVNSSNSLVGTSTNDYIGIGVVAILTNGNYVACSYLWNNGAATSAGAVTWCPANSPVTGVVSSANSLVGSTTDDKIGELGVNVLSNGNYLVRAYNWDNGAAVDAGAVAWGNGSTGVSGPVSSVNSLVGNTGANQVGLSLAVLNNGNYVVGSPVWDDGAILDAGAATWGNGLTGITGTINVSNSLIGTHSFDQVGFNGITALQNGNYVVCSTNWDNGTTSNVGAATWCDGTTGTTGVVSTANSLVGSIAGDQVGTFAIALKNGNYIVSSQNWDNGAIVNAGAVTWCDGTTGTTGVVSSANSLVGSTASDMIGSNRTVALSNGNYVVSSPNWDNGAITDAGAITWCNGTAGTTGIINSTNSLVGSTASDRLGSNQVIALTNGNYVVSSPNWDNGSIANAGAATWGNGATGTSGSISSSNSLIGSTANDQVGRTGVIALTNGNYVVTSPDWDFGGIANAGAVTWGNGNTGVTGTINSNNSLIGAQFADGVGDAGVTRLTNGNYTVYSSAWNNGTITASGAVTLSSSGSTGISGFITGCNSVIANIANGGTTLFPAYNSTYDYLLTGRRMENMVTIFKPAAPSLALSNDQVSLAVNGIPVPLITTTNCRIIATLAPAGAAPVAGIVNAKAWIEPSVPAFLGQPFVARHFEIIPASNAASATGRITFYCTQQEFDDFNADAGSILDLPTGPADATGIANIRIGKYAGTSNDGTGLPGSYTGGATVLDPADADIIWNSSLNRWEISVDVTGFSGFIIQTSHFVLPLTLFSFSAHLHDGNVLLNWKTSNEINTLRFDIERSTDGQHFMKIGDVAAANTAADHYYQYADREIPRDKNSLFYRLRMIDADDYYTYSRVILLQLSHTAGTILYPNPATDATHLTVNDAALLGTTAIITDIQGKQIKQIRIDNYQVPVQVNGLAKGVYLLKIADGSTLKFIKN